MRDYYEILGVERGCDDGALKAAFRKLAMEHHPDRNGGCEEAEGRFKEVNEAYSVLSDPQKRAAYDRFGHAGVNGQGGGGAQFHDVHDIFTRCSATSSATCSAGAAAAASAAGRRAATTCATTWRSSWSRPMP